jgi:hypothetical protein
MLKMMYNFISTAITVLILGSIVYKVISPFGSTKKANSPKEKIELQREENLRHRNNTYGKIIDDNNLTFQLSNSLYETANKIYQLSNMEVKIRDDCNNPKNEPIGGDTSEYTPSKDPKEDYLRRREYNIRRSKIGTSKEANISKSERNRRKYQEKHLNQYTKEILIYGADMLSKSLNEMFSKGFYTNIASSNQACRGYSDPAGYKNKENDSSYTETLEGVKFIDRLCKDNILLKGYRKEGFILMEAGQNLYSRHLLYLELLKKFKKDNTEYLVKFNELHQELLKHPYLKDIKLKKILPFKLTFKSLKRAKVDDNIIRFDKCIEP